jgi:hypothetical protein
MAQVNIQTAITEYHKMMEDMGMDMHRFHAIWHLKNRSPSRPDNPDENWGMNNDYGEKFLQMHHEMTRSSDDEPKYCMRHQSIFSWFEQQQFDLPKEWNPLLLIPEELTYDTQDSRLKRITNDPKYALPKYYTVNGIGPHEDPEPITGARKLADFKNVNQLGCCISFPHFEWHNAIGGAMKIMAMAIDDPVFYFGVHWHIDKIFEAYKSIPKNKMYMHRMLPEKFSITDLKKLKTPEELGIRIWE